MTTGCAVKADMKHFEKYIARLEMLGNQSAYFSGYSPMEDVLIRRCFKICEGPRQ